MAGKVVLHVEDDDPAAYLLRSALQHLEMAIVVFRVCDGETAQAFLHCRGPYFDAPRPDLIVVDLKLPRMSGWELLEKVKQDESLRSIPTVIFSHLDDSDDKPRASVLGVQAIILKPFLDYAPWLESVGSAFSQLLKES